MSISTLEKRVEALEAATGGSGGGCPRCVGTLIIVSETISGKFHSASWNGEDISEEVARQHRTERKCPWYGRKLDPGERSMISIGGRRR